MSNLRPAPLELSPPRIDALMGALNAHDDRNLLARLGFDADEIAAVERVARSQRTSMARVVRGMVAVSCSVLERIG